MAYVLVNHPLAGDFVVESSEGAILRAYRPNDVADAIAADDERWQTADDDDLVPFLVSAEEDGITHRRALPATLVPHATVKAEPAHVTSEETGRTETTASDEQVHNAEGDA